MMPDPDALFQIPNPHLNPFLILVPSVPTRIPIRARIRIREPRNGMPMGMRMANVSRARTENKDAELFCRKPFASAFGFEHGGFICRTGSANANARALPERLFRALLREGEREWES